MDLKGQKNKTAQKILNNVAPDCLINAKTSNHYKVIAEWEHYALLSLIETDDFQSNISWMAQRLNTSVLIVESALERLQQLKLIDVDKEGNYFCTFSRLDIPSGIMCDALKQAHLEELDLAKKSLNLPMNLRHFASETVAIDPKNIEKANDLINKFRKELSELLEQGSRTEVYQVSIQVYPLTVIGGTQL
jgi:uncharacterized protein (TIGR02147 family)